MKLSDGFNGADLRNVCTEAGLFVHFFFFMTKIAKKKNIIATIIEPTRFVQFSLPDENILNI